MHTNVTLCNFCTILTIFCSGSHEYHRIGIQNRRPSTRTDHAHMDGCLTSYTFNDSPHFSLEANHSSSLSLNPRSLARSDTKMPQEGARVYRRQDYLSRIANEFSPCFRISFPITPKSLVATKVLKQIVVKHTIK